MLMHTYKIACDQCNKDITYTDGYTDYRILLTSECKKSMPREDGLCVSTLAYVRDPFPKKLHFCNKGCLKQWINKEDKA